MTQPALNTTFDTSLIDLSQDHSRHQTTSFSTTESIPSQDGILGVQIPQTDQIVSRAQSRERILETISEAIPPFLSSIESATLSDNHATAPEITFVNFRTSPVPTNAEESCIPTHSIIFEWLSRRFNDTIPTANISTIEYHAIEGGDLTSRINISHEASRHTSYQGVVVAMSSENHPVGEYVEFIKSRLTERGTVLLYSVQASQELSDEPVKSFEYSGFDRKGDVICREVRDVWILAAVFQKS
jgi:hypothetical protein